MKLTRAEYEAILRRDLNAFIERTFAELNPQTGFMPAAHIEVIAAMLQAVSRGEITRLIINLPPRHLKSLCASVAFPAWYLGQHPSAHVICASYGQELADKLARDCRAVMTSRWYQSLFPTRLAGRTAIHDFTTTANGGRMATSVGGVLTGRGADLIVIDDPLKPDEALSASRRTAVNEWYDNSLLSRLDDKARGAIVIVMQRLHQDDLVGHVLEQGRWQVLSFAAIAEEDETHRIDTFYGQRCFHRRTGEALQPERETLATLAAIRQTIGDYNFSAQYQQSPVPLGGALVKRHWLRFYDEGDRPARFSRIVQSWDTANKASELNDFSVCTTWGVLNRHFYLLDVFRQRLNYPDLRRRVEDLADRHIAANVVIEDRASGTQLLQDLRGTIVGLRAYSPPPATDKVMRLHAQSAVFENGFVFLPRAAPWLTAYIDEITGFPGSRYDDQVDSTTQAIDYLRFHDALAVWERLAG